MGKILNIKEFTEKLNKAKIEVIKKSLGRERHIIKKEGFYPEERILKDSAYNKSSIDFEEDCKSMTAITYRYNYQYYQDHFREFYYEYQDFYEKEKDAFNFAMKIIKSNKRLIYSIVIQFIDIDCGEKGWTLRIREYE